MVGVEEAALRRITDTQNRADPFVPHCDVGSSLYINIKNNYLETAGLPLKLIIREQMAYTVAPTCLCSRSAFLQVSQVHKSALYLVLKTVLDLFCSHFPSINVRYDSRGMLPHFKSVMLL